jgi:hypothetical protein
MPRFPSRSRARFPHRGLAAVTLLASACSDPRPATADATGDSTAFATSGVSADTTTATTDVDESTSGSTGADGVTSNAQSDTDDASSGSTGSNAAPVAGDDVFRTPMDTPLEVPDFPGVLGNDHDGEGGVASIDFVDAMSERGGVIAHRDDGGFSYTPPPARGGPTASSTASSTISVRPHPPA